MSQVEKVDVRTVLQPLLRDYQFASIEHGKTGENAVAVDEAEERLVAAVAELVAAADAFARDDRQRAWHAAYRPMMDRLRAALRPFNGSDKA